MSVWKSACYRDDTLQHFLRYVRPMIANGPFLQSLADFTIEDPGIFPLPNGLLPGSFRDQVTTAFTPYESIYCNGVKRVRNSIEKLCLKLPKAYYGLSAVYRFYLELEGYLQSPKYADADTSLCANSIFQFGGAASLHSAKDTVMRGAVLSSAVTKYLEPARQMIRLLLRIYGAGRAKSYNMEKFIADAQDTSYPSLQFVPFPGMFTIYNVEGALIFHNEPAGTCYVLLKQDIDRLERLIVGVAEIHEYISMYSILKLGEKARMEAFFAQCLGEFRQAVKKSDNDSVNYVCRAFDVCYHTILAEFAQDISFRAVKEQRDKAIAEGLDRIINITMLTKTAAEIPIKEALEVALWYKVLPQPDFDYFGTMARQKIMYDNPNPINVTDPNGFETVLAWYKWLMIVAFYNVHHECPGMLREDAPDEDWASMYPRIKPSAIPITGVQYIDLRNSFLFRQYGTDVLGLVKDKAICPETIKAVRHQDDLNHLPRQSKNHLLNVILRPVPIDMLKLYPEIDLLFNDVKADDKPEAKKPFGRLFMEAHTDMRLLNSEYEESVTHYAKTLEGYLQGKHLGEKINLMNRVSEFHSPVDGYSSVIISFDLKRWSPQMNPKVHPALDKLWSEAFGMPHLERINRQFLEGNLHYVRRNIHHVMEKTGADYEGWGGKRLTMYQLAVMYYTLSNLRSKGYIDKPARFACQIDDGILRLLVKTDRLKELLQPIMDCIEDSYRNAGLVISWDKTFVSTRLSVFLNEVRFIGRSVTPGLRTILKITNRSDDPVPSMLSDLATLASTTRGAISSGAPPMAAYGIYSVMATDTLHRWGKRDLQLSQTHAIRFFASVNFGGYGGASMLQLMGSLEENTHSGSLGALRLIARVFPLTIKTINLIINQPIKPMPTNLTVTNPVAFRIQSRVLRGDRGLMVVERHLMRRVSTPVLSALAATDSAQPSTVLGSFISMTQTVPVELRELFSQATFLVALRQLATKFLRARTALTLVPKKALFRAFLANQTESAILVQ